MRTFIRFLAGAALLIAVLAAVNDATRTLSTGGFAATPLIDHWSKLSPSTLAAARGSVQRYTHPLLWDAMARTVLLLPAWAVFGGLGLLLGYAGRRRRSVNVFAN